MSQDSARQRLRLRSESPFVGERRRELQRGPPSEKVVGPTRHESCRIPLMIITGHELVTDLNHLVRHGFDVHLPNVIWFDTAIASKWLWPDLSDHSLEHLVLRATNMSQWRPTIGKLKLKDFEAMSDDDLKRRCGGDAEAPVHLARILAQEIRRSGLVRVWNLAMAVLPILAEIGGRGMAIDMAKLKRRADGSRVYSYGHWLKRERQSLETLLGIQNLDSYTQLADALFTEHHATPLRKTKTGFSTDRTSLLWARRQAQEHGNHDLQAILDRLLVWKAKKKIYSTYYLGWVNNPATEDGHIHSFYSLGGTATGRMSSWDENLQNIPKEVRELIIPSDGFDLILQSDFKQLEVCVAAQISQDPVMVQWVREKRDIHSIMASRVMGFPEPQTQDDFARFKTEHPSERATGKMAMFATLYGITADSLCWKIFGDTDGAIYIEEDDAQRYIDAFFDAFQGYRAFTSDLRVAIDRHEWITSPFGRRWLLPNNEAGWRKAQNYPVQATASDLTILALWIIYWELRRRGLKTRPIGEVHDSIIFETTKKELQEVSRLVTHVCENLPTERYGFTLRVPLSVEIQVGENGKDLRSPTL